MRAILIILIIGVGCSERVQSDTFNAPPNPSDPIGPNPGDRGTDYDAQGRTGSTGKTGPT